jgi:mannosyl-oligosaccharide glucosidase
MVSTTHRGYGVHTGQICTLGYGLRSPSRYRWVSCGLMRTTCPKSTRVGYQHAPLSATSSLTPYLCPGLRYACEADDGMAGYGWTFYDSRTGGSQMMNDTENRVDIITDFVKSMDPESQEWQLRVRGIPRAGADEHQKTTVVFYLGSENPLSKMTCKRHHSHRVWYSDVACRGITPTIGEFSVDIGVSGSRGDLLQYLVVDSMAIPVKNMWQIKSVFVDELKNRGTGDGFIPNKPGDGNLHFVQITFEGSNEIEVSFTSGHEHQTVTSVPLAKRLEIVYADFQKQFALTYLPQPPFKGKQYVEFSQSLLSNLMGGIGYFYGRDRISLDSKSEFTDTEDDFWMYESLGESQQLVQERGPRQLLTSVPSRPLLSHGFLWDEGFHLQIILEWDMDLALTMVSSWFDLMDDDGWIAREQILGQEARNKVPPLFQVQFPHFANPPTLFTVIETFAEMLKTDWSPSGTSRQYLTDPATGKIWLETIYPKMKKHYEWFRRTQSGNMTHYRHSDPLSQGYRWRGRTSQHIQPSGLGDYPRAQPPYLEELHVDALSWIGSMATTLRKISAILGKKEDEATFSTHEAIIRHSIDGIHWSTTSQAYCDTTIDEKHQITHICHKGYVSLFPFLLGHLNTSHPHLEAVLDLMRNPGELWSPYGLRSLSRSDRYHSRGENYCRGPIWININYMVLKQLLSLSAKPSPLQRKIRKLYTELRTNIVDTVYTSWAETNTVWEQYNSDTGKGQRTRSFTGWTALIVKIMSMPELEPSVSSHKNQSKLKPGEGLRGTGHYSKTFLFSSIAMLVICLAYRKKLSLVMSRLRRP